MALSESIHTWAFTQTRTKAVPGWRRDTVPIWNPGAGSTIRTAATSADRVRTRASPFKDVLARHKQHRCRAGGIARRMACLPQGDLLGVFQLRAPELYVQGLAHRSFRKQRRGSDNSTAGAPWEAVHSTRTSRGHRHLGPLRAGQQQPQFSPNPHCTLTSARRCRR